MSPRSEEMGVIKVVAEVEAEVVAEGKILLRMKTRRGSSTNQRSSVTTARNTDTLHMNAEARRRSEMNMPMCLSPHLLQRQHFHLFQR